MESVYQNKEACCGCGACAAACAKGALRMTADAEGFAYPRLDAAACADCGRCRAVCPLQAVEQGKAAGEPRFYLAKHRDPAVLAASTSGGAFTALSDAILRRGGVIYGAVFDEALRVRHARAATAAERDAMRVSKYVQSDTAASFRQVKHDLCAGLPVLFSGTPCQCAALRCFCAGLAPQARRLLYLCDLICHSVPSPLFWEDYKRLLAAEAGAPLAWARFRGKDVPWLRANSNKGFAYRVAGEAQPRTDDRFYHLFIEAGVLARPSCYACPYADGRRAGDVTIADYFGIEDFEPARYDPLGVSLLLVSTAQGEALRKASAGDMLLEERPPAEAMSVQGRLRAPLPRPAARDSFWRDYQEKGIAWCLKHY